MKIDKAKLESLKIRFPLRWNSVYMYGVEQGAKPLFQVLGHSASHSAYMIARGKFLVDLLNQAALEAGIISEIPVPAPSPIRHEPEAQETPVSDESSPIVEPEVKEDGMPVIEKVDFKKRGRGRPKSS